METIAIEHFKKNMKSFFNKVCTDRQPLTIADTQNGDIVIISKAEYDRIQETFNLIKNTNNVIRP
ncbi:MAG: prevent-host-death family protein [Mucilaginibacter sp.]|nr:prevent-host-death family protein [Mucilaginibacter sp.]